MKPSNCRLASRARAKRGSWRAVAGGVTSALLAGWATAAAADSASEPAGNAPNHPFLSPKAITPSFLSLAGLAVPDGELDSQMAAHRTVPFWRGTITSPLSPNPFRTTMVGASPYDARPGRTAIGFTPIIARVHFSDGTVLDPTQPSACDPVPPQTRFLNSPLFNSASFTSNGVDVSAGVRGGTQLVSAFQRANYWAAVQNTQYGVELRSARAPIVVDVDAPLGSQVVSVTAKCPSGDDLTVPFGLTDLASFQSIVAGLLGRFAQPDELGVVVTYDIAWTQHGCCIIGFHGALPVARGTQTYAVAAYADPGVFTTPIEDIYAWAHELAEWVDDPFYQQKVRGGGETDETPAWGHVNQVSGCLGDLEVGDPLNGAGVFEIQGNGGFLYHYQDLAFHDWFYRTPASGAGGLYSFQGLFTTDAGPKCVKSGS